MSEVTRFPYQDPQTSMERHIAEMVRHLREGTDNRAGFAETVERGMARAFWLEQQCESMSEEIVRLERALAPSLPSISCNSSETDTRDPLSQTSVGALAFEWNMEPIRWRCLWRSWDLQGKTAKRVKCRAYKDILKLFRREFERTWTINVDGRRPEWRRRVRP